MVSSTFALETRPVHEEMWEIHLEVELSELWDFAIKCVCVCGWCVQDTDTLWLDYHQNINDKPLTTMDTYVAQFPDIKVRLLVFILKKAPRCGG